MSDFSVLRLCLLPLSLMADAAPDSGPPADWEGGHLWAAGSAARAVPAGSAAAAARDVSAGRAPRAGPAAAAPRDASAGRAPHPVRAVDAPRALPAVRGPRAVSAARAAGAGPAADAPRKVSCRPARVPAAAVPIAARPASPA